MSSQSMPHTVAYSINSTLGQSSSDGDKYVTFKLADYLFALPSNKILKVVPTPPPSQGGMVSMGLVQLEQYSIQTLDLPTMMNLQGESAGISGIEQSRRSADSQQVETTQEESSKRATETPSRKTKNPPFLIVLQDAEEALWGIAVHEPPDLIDIPHYALKSVPSEKRLTRALRWVSHVVTYDLGDDRHTLLVLDLSILLSTKPAHSHAEAPVLLEIAPPLQAEPIAELTSTEPCLEIEPPMELAESEVEVSGRKEEMYA